MQKTDSTYNQIFGSSKTNPPSGRGLFAKELVDKNGDKKFKPEKSPFGLLIGTNPPASETLFGNMTYYSDQIKNQNSSL
jgi:hypothetical protein